MLKNIFATLIVLSSLALTGCTMANRPKVEKYPDLTKTEEIIIKGKSDIRDVREIFGAPTVKGRTLNEDHLVLGYAIMSYKEFGDSSLKSRLLNALTLKEADCWSTTFTQKNVYFKFDKERKPLFDHEYLREPPSKISPSELSYLINEKEIVTEAFNATLISLIRKKYLKIDSY